MNDYDCMQHVVSLAFDGVIVDVSKESKGKELIDLKPRNGIRKLFARLREEGYRIEILTLRCSTPEGRAEVIHWLIVQGLIGYVDAISDKKRPALCYIAPNAIPFIDCENVIRQIENLKEKNNEQ